MGIRDMSAVRSFDWDGLAQYKAEKAWLDRYPADVRTFWTDRDDVHGVLVSLLGSARHSLVLAMYGYDDEELDRIIRAKAQDESVYVQLSLDKAQASGVHEREILKSWHHEALGTSVAIGHSSHGAIAHAKVCIVDGIYTVRGSTNWSAGGEAKQNNELTLHRDAVLAAETRAVCDRWHDQMLQQMAA